MTNLNFWTYDWVPEMPRGFVRDLRLRWACEEAGLPYPVRTPPWWFLGVTGEVPNGLDGWLAKRLHQLAHFAAADGARAEADPCKEALENRAMTVKPGSAA